MTRVVNGVDELKTLVGQEVGCSDWQNVPQEQINRFADVTGDHQWIHVDVDRTRRESPYGGPIAHGFLTVSLLGKLMAGAVEVRVPHKMRIN